MLKDRYLALFESYYKEKFRRNTVKLYLIELNRFLSNVDLNQKFNKEMVDSYLLQVNQSRTITTLKHFFRLLIKKKMIDNDPLASVEIPKQKHRYLELFSEYLKSERNLSESSVKSYIADLISFTKYIDLNQEVTEVQVTEYISRLNEDGVQDSTLNRKISSLKQFFQFLVSEEIIKTNPMTFIKQPKSRRSLPKIVSEDVMKKLREAIESLSLVESVRLDLMICLLYGSGLRVSELISLKQNAFIENKFIRIFGKGRKERIVPMAHRVIELLEQWNQLKQDSEWLFPSVNPDKHITRQRVFQLLKQLAIMSGMDPEKISPHVLRHAFATHVLDHGADILSVKKMLGHESVATTEIYTHVSRGRLRKVVDLYHPLGSSAVKKFKD